MFLAQLTLGAAQDRRVGTGMRRRMFGIAEAMVDSAAFSDQQFPVTQLWQSPPAPPQPGGLGPLPAPERQPMLSELAKPWLCGYTDGIPIALGNFCFLLPGS